MNSLAPKLLVCVVLTMLMSCATSVKDVLDSASDSVEASNSVFLDLNEKLDKDIQSLNAKDSVLVLTAHGLFEANENVNEVITTFKKEINNLKLVGMADDHVQLFFSSPPSWVLSSMVSNVDTSAAQLMNKSINKSKLAPVSRWARSFHTDSLWFKKYVEGQGYHSALLELSKVQRSCSMATNVALNEVLNTLRKDL
jgi:REP element-mobilizing transposase RayT